MDPLSDVLRAVRLDGAFFYVVEGTAPWSVSIAAARERRPRVLPQAEHLMAYHIATEGTCWFAGPGGVTVMLQQGDVILFPHGDPHVASHQRLGSPPREVHTEVPSQPLEVVRLGSGAGARVSLICGFLGCDARPYNPLLSALPRCIHVRAVTVGWLAEFPRQVVAQGWQSRPGGAAMLNRMAELMFVEVLRRYSEELSPNTGWLAGLRDPIVAPAIAALHARPAHQWSLAELAQVATTSRTVLAERFSQMVGLAPMQYLTEWRLQLAAEELSGGSKKIAAVAAAVGYESEAAFSRAFKRNTGMSPAAWRKVRQTGGGGAGAA